ncbi:hypothetical protein PG637_02515 [Riemerella anatipestifer]|nr:hypothetical protein [Riemerella anatipestifer]MDY3324545.1 hypothetical protein [Riemerella anatipestifer]MDY3353355.1 hypothetical protein [Riemerella anatipestifer]
MKLNQTLMVFLMLILLVNDALAQKDKVELKKNRVEQALDSTSIKKDTMNEENSILEIKDFLVKEYLQSERSKQQSSKDKLILGVGWFDSSFSKITSTIQGEPISIAILTEGYKIGDKIEVTLGSEENGEEDTLVPGIKCSEITFIGYVNYENFAFLKNIFTVEGEKEQLNIFPEWKDRYICK